MKFVDEYRDAGLVRRLAEETSRLAGRRELTFMEVCGTHTMSIFRNGIRVLLPATLRLLSGPGCPVCVTPNRYLDHAIALSRLPGITITTFGDMMRVPGSTSSLERERAVGRDIRVVYSPLDALELARRNPSREIVFLGVGFETTSPGVAAAVQLAGSRHLSNISFLVAHKVIPPAMRALIEGGVAIDGFLCPGHVSVITGSKPYEFLARDYGHPCVVAGFEAADVLEAILMLVRQAIAGEAAVEIQYRRAVTQEGNKEAQRLLNSTFDTVDSEWRGIGSIPESGLSLRAELKGLDAAEKFEVEVEPTLEPKGCRCGEVLQGRITPNTCPLFGTACTPENPVGSCMVSSEGTCAAWYRYARMPEDCL